jgi:hypothetical protein
MPLNAARKKRARQLSEATGMPYTASLGLLDRRPELAGQVLWSPERLLRFGRPVAVVAEPALPGPWCEYGSSYNDRPYEIRLSYGLFRRPGLKILTAYALPGDDRPQSRLHDTFANFLTTQGRMTGGRKSPDDARLSREAFVRRVRELRAVVEERIEVRLDGRPVMANRVLVADFEAVEFGHDDVRIVCCGHRGLGDTVRFDFEMPVATSALRCGL